MRNFWMDAHVDGRETPVGAGPRAKDGGMSATFRMRGGGNSVEAVRVVCYEQNGELVVRVVADGKTVYEKWTRR